MTKSDRGGYKFEVGLELKGLTLLEIEMERTVLALEIEPTKT